MRCDLCSCNYPGGCHLSHINGKQHQKNLLGGQSYCGLCACRSSGPFKQHEEGKRHQKKLKASRNPKTRNIPSHRHRRNFATMTERDNYDIQLTGDSLDFGVVNGDTTSQKHLSIINKGTETVKIQYIRLSSSTSIFQVVDERRNCRLTRKGRTSAIVELVPLAAERGLFEDCLEIHISIPLLQKQFSITRPIKAIIGSSSDYDTLQPTVSYSGPPKNINLGKIRHFSPGIPPQFLASISWAKKLDDYSVPSEKIDAIYQESSVQKAIDIARSVFEISDFDTGSYTRYMQAMLWIEEEKAKRELEWYNMEAVKMDPNGVYYELQVDGLAEKRPSIILGDSILARTSGEEGHWYQGFVHNVKERSVLLRFEKKFNGLKGQNYDIVFQLRRLVFRRMHQAITIGSELGWVTFPNASIAEKLVSLDPVDINLTLFDRKIQSNPAQLQAVTAITRLPQGCVPFIVYGPPGTGKTVTIVEAIRQILDKDPNTKILACAPSNAAADVITERLSSLDRKIMFRSMAPSRSNIIPFLSDTILKFTHINEHRVFECPPPEKLKDYRVIVSTCCSASVPYGIGVDPGHFSHIFVDEAGQATEAEVMIPIRMSLGQESRLILSGDIKQLGPIVRSSVARELGLGVSYLERLMLNPLYGELQGRGRTFVKLTKNWRSHPTILKFPSDEFYAGELEACADPVITHSLLSWSKLEGRKRPIIFHSICGRDQREASSPSYFNIDEASLVKDYVKELLGENGLRLKAADIGVITPYRSQVTKIRSLLKTFAAETRVGSVEEYQGQERRVIIISTVRSTPDLINFDLKHTLGFVANPRRLNVAITRARALLIVIGDPFVLSLDPLWKAFINYVHLEGVVLGRSIDWDFRIPIDRSENLEETRRTQEQARLTEIIRRTSERVLGLGDGLDGDDLDEDAAAFNIPLREEE